MDRHVSPEQKAASRLKSNEALRKHGFATRTPEERSRIAKLGNLAQQKYKKRRKTLLEIITTLGMMDATKQEKEMFMQMFPDADPAEITKDMMLIASMYNQGIRKGNVQATNFLRDTAGEKPDTNISGSLVTEKIFVTEKEHKEALKHIAEVVADGNGDR